MFSIASGALLDGRHRIVAKVDALMALCDQPEDSLTAATTIRYRLFEALLHEALGDAGGQRAT